ncbi:MAG TPA: PAS domain S-box protein [Gallionella sp.]|nr:PAS domain S-box protein [Gallionella sp.]
MNSKSFLTHLKAVRHTPAGIALLYAALAALWIALSGYLLTITVTDPLLQNRIELAKGLAFVVATGTLLYILLKGWNKYSGNATPVSASDIAKPNILLLLLTLILLVLVVPAMVVTIYELRVAAREDSAYQNLGAIAELKGRQIEQWLAERGSDAQGLAENTGFAAQLEDFQSSAPKAIPNRAISAELRSMQTNHGFDTILLFAPDGRLLSALGSDTDKPPENLMRQALSEGKVIFSDLYQYQPGNSHIHLDWFVPIIATGLHGKRTAGLAVLRTLPGNFLYPLIQTWPGKSSSGETLLVRSAGNGVQFLNDLRFHKKSALTIYGKLANPDLPAAIAIRANKPGTTSGTDYRGIPVLAAYRPVAGTSWQLIAKQDQSEVLQPVRDLMYWVSGIGAAAVFIILVLLLMFLRQQQRMHQIALLARSSASLRENNELLRLFIEHAPAAIAMFDREMRYLGFSKRWIKDYRLDGIEILGRSHYEVFPQIPERWKALHARAMKGEVLSSDGDCFEMADGTTAWLKWEIRPWAADAGKTGGIVIFSEDITERKRAEQSLLKLKQAVEQSPSSIVITDLNANIEYANPAFVRESGYSLDEFLGSNPRLLHSGKTPKAAYDDLWLNLASEKTWKGEFINRRKDGSEYIESAIISPVFQPDGRMTHFLAVKENITERKQAEAELMASKASLDAALDSMSDAVFITDSDGRLIQFNDACAAFHKFKSKEACPKSLDEYYKILEKYSPDGELLAKAQWAVPRALRGESAANAEFTLKRKDSGETWIGSYNYAPIRDRDGRVTGSVVAARDITARKSAEAKILRLTQLYASLSQCNQAIVHCTSAEELFSQVCHDSVRFGGMKMVWIGMVDKTDKQVRPVAAYGDITELLDGIHISVDGNEAAGRGPVGIAIRENRPYWCQDYEQDSNLDPWRDRGMQFGVKSLAALPLRLNGTPVGNINFYSSTLNAFDDEACELLTEMATDISFALDNFDREAERRKAEALLKKNEALLSEVGRIATVGGWEFDTRTGEGTWTQEVARIHDMDPEAHTSRDIALDFYQGESRQKIGAAIAAASADGTPYDLELEMVTAKGNRKWVRTIAVADKEGDKVVRLRGTFQDITKLKQSEREMIFKNTLLETQQEASLDAILIVNENGKILSYNQNFIEMWHLPPELVSAREDGPVLQAVTDQVENPEAFYARVQHLFAHPEEKSSEEIKLKDRRIIERYTSPIAGSDGQHFGIVAYFRDISERKHAEQELLDSEQRFRGLVEQSLAGIYIIQDGKFVYLNKRGAEIIGYESAEDMIGQDPLQYTYEEERVRVAEFMRKLFQRELQSVAIDFKATHKNGSLIDVGLNASLATYHGLPAMIGLIQDISEKKRAEEQILGYISQLKDTFMSTVQLATSLGEMRDPYTAGHERRVSEIAVAIATEMGLGEQRIEGIKVAGFLHDIGKISLPAEILVKPGRLTATEYALVQGHAQASFDVLKQVEFPWPVATIALQHHERLDGSGYPNGLKGGEILLESRIMAVADVVEAMASHRPYRPGLGIDKALTELERGRGSAYDPDVVDTCLRLFREQEFVLPPY